MPKAIEGTYRAKVLPATFEKVGEKDTPMMKVHFEPKGQVVDKEVKPEEGLPRVNKAYFLSLDVVTNGKYAGKSQMEALKLQLEEEYGYTGAFNPTAINEHLTNLGDRDIVCVKNDKGYTNVKYVNPPGGSAKGKKPIKTLDESEIAGFAKLFDSGSKAMNPTDAKSLFESLTSGTPGGSNGQ
jgi:hypothetical protein